MQRVQRTCKYSSLLGLCVYCSMRLLCKHMHIVQHSRSLSYWIAVFVGSLWMQPLTHDLTLLIFLQCAKRQRPGQYSYWFLRSFSRHNFWTKTFHENRLFKIQASVVLNPLVSLFGCLVVRSARISGDRHIDTQTHTHTHTYTHTHTNTHTHSDTDQVP